MQSVLLAVGQCSVQQRIKKRLMLLLATTMLTVVPIRLLYLPSQEFK